LEIDTAVSTTRLETPSQTAAAQTARADIALHAIRDELGTISIRLQSAAAWSTESNEPMHLPTGEFLTHRDDLAIPRFASLRQTLGDVYGRVEHINEAVRRDQIHAGTRAQAMALRGSVDSARVAITGLLDH
jgi:hypothetical protein